VAYNAGVQIYAQFLQVFLLANDSIISIADDNLSIKGLYHFSRLPKPLPRIREAFIGTRYFIVSLALGRERFVAPKMFKVALGQGVLLKIIYSKVNAVALYDDTNLALSAQAFNIYHRFRSVENVISGGIGIA
jgi:hypothetical protein